MRAAIAAALLGLLVSGCNTVHPIEGSATPLGKNLELHLPAAPGFPETMNATQTVVGQYGERRAAFQAVLTLSPATAQVVLTTPGGPRILTITWTSAGIVEDRTPLAPEDLKGINVLGDIFVSLWPVEAVRAALPAGVTVAEAGPKRTIRAGERTIVEVEHLEKRVEDGKGLLRQKLTNLDFGYSLTIITETGE
jgi:hypothetical protein